MRIDQLEQVGSCQWCCRVLVFDESDNRYYDPDGGWYCFGAPAPLDYHEVAS